MIGRLKRTGETEYADWCRRDVSRDRWVYLWADGIYSGLRAEHQKLCALVVIGVNERGEKHFLAIEDGVRESTQSWREVLLDLKKRGLEVPPKLAVGDGALGFWSALDEVYPDTRHQRCWVHKTAQACLRPRDRFWDIPVPKIDSAFDNLLVPQPSWSPSTAQQLRKLVAAPYLSPNDWTPRLDAYFASPLALGKQCGLAATGVYQPSLRSPWLAA